MEDQDFTKEEIFKKLKLSDKLTSAQMDAAREKLWACGKAFAVKNKRAKTTDVVEHRYR